MSHHRHTAAKASATSPSLNRTAFDATVHCLTGCAIGEVLGLAIATALGWRDVPSIALAVVLSFGFGYGLTIGPLIRGGLAFQSALRLALIGDTVSIGVIELTDNAVVLAVPGAMDAGLADLLFWGSLAASLAIAFLVALPVNRWLIRRGLGHAAAPAHH